MQLNLIDPILKKAQRLISLSFLFLFSCGPQTKVLSSSKIPLIRTKPTPTPTPFRPDLTPSFIKKTYSDYDNITMEASPVVFNDHLYMISFLREPSHVGRSIRIYDYFSKQIISEHNWDYAFGAAFVNNGILYAFGSNTPYIGMISTTDLFTWTNPVHVLTSVQDQSFYNVSITKGPLGYVMIYEVSEPNTTGYLFRAAYSSDLVNWTKIGIIYPNKSYAACPTIRYSNGYYQVLYLSYGNGGIVTYLTRTKDFITYEENSKIVLSFGNDEGINASDIDLIEYNGAVYISYDDGDQTYWDNLRTAKYEGTLDQFFNEFWIE